MAKLPPIGTTAGQTAKKPQLTPTGLAPLTPPPNMDAMYHQGLGPLSLLLQQMEQGNMPAGPNKPIVQMPQSPATPQGGTQYPLGEMIGDAWSNVQAQATYLNRARPEENKGPLTVEEYLKLINADVDPLILEKMPKALPGITLPRPPQRDVRAEGKDRAQQNQLAGLLPLLSLIATGSVETGQRAFSGAYSALDTGAKGFQNELATAENQNYGDNLDVMLKQRALDERARDQEVETVQNANQQKVQARQDKQRTIISLLGLANAERKVEDAERKTLGTARKAFLNELSRLSRKGQLAYWQTNAQQALDLGLAPTYDENNNYIKIDRESDLIGYANAKNGEDRNKALFKIAGMVDQRRKESIAQQYAAVKNQKEMNALNNSTRLEVARLARAGAMDRLLRSETGRNYRAGQARELTRYQIWQRWKTTEGSDAFKKLTKLFTYQQSLTGDIARAEAAITGIQKATDKFESDEAREQRIQAHELARKGAVAKLLEINPYIVALEDAADEGDVTEGVIEEMTGESLMEQADAYFKANGIPTDEPAPVPGTAPARVTPPKTITAKPPQKRVTPKYEKGFNGRPPAVSRGARPAPKSGGGEWITETDPDTGKKFRMRKKN